MVQSLRAAIASSMFALLPPTMRRLPTRIIGRRIILGSSTIRRIRASGSIESCRSPKVLSEGLLQATTSCGGLFCKSWRNSPSVKRSTKKSRKSIFTPACESNSLTFLQLLHFAHQYRVALLFMVESLLALLVVAHIAW